VIVRQMPVIVCHDMQQVKYDGDVYFMEIRVTAEPVGDAKAARWNGTIPVGLGRRIADLIMAECGMPPSGAGVAGEPG